MTSYRSDDRPARTPIARGLGFARAKPNDLLEFSGRVEPLERRRTQDARTNLRITFKLCVSEALFLRQIQLHGKHPIRN